MEHNCSPQLSRTSVSGAATPSPGLQIRDFIADAAFPCVGAKSAMNKGRMEVQEFGALADPAHARALHAAIADYAQRHPEPGTAPVTWIATFDDEGMDERSFEAKLWQQLQQLHEIDVAAGTPWAAGVSADPNREDFSFSIAGRAFFIVGLYPGASRLARRAPQPCMVFNFHDQFELLKANGKYTSMQDAIRKRDIALQGSINPVLARFGESSEARQYSGRAVEAGWTCPFHSKATQNA